MATTRKHADGHILNAKGERIGRWDDNVHGVRQWAITKGEDPDKAEAKWRTAFRAEHGGPGDIIVKKVEGYYESNKNRADRGHGENWLRVLVAFGQYQERGLKPYSAAEAWESAKKWGGWKEIAQCLERLEAANYAFAHGYDPKAGVYQQDGTDGYVAPDDERWGNDRHSEDEASSASSSPQGAPETPPEASQIAPEHVDRFCEYLERERALVAHECGSQHPAIKCGTYEAYIEDVRSGERVHSQIMFNYNQFLEWLRGERGQRTADDTNVWADGTVEDLNAPLDAEEAADKAEQDAYAEEVKQFQAARDAGDEDAQQGFDEWRHRKDNPDSPFGNNGVYVLDKRTGCYISHDKVYRQRHELTSKNVRYRLSRHPDGMVQISWLALNYEGCLCFLPHNTETKTRMVPAEEVRKLIVDGWRVLTHKQYCKNQSGMGAKHDKFESFCLWAQYSPKGDPLGICPTQGDSSDGKWKHDDELWANILTSHQVEEIAPVDAPVDVANAILAGDWAEVARLAQRRALGS